MHLKIVLISILWILAGLKADAQGNIYAASGSGTAGATSIDWVLGSLSTDASPGAIALPVQFGTISAAIGNSRLLVKWATETETRNDHFDIEVSSDGTRFKTIGSVISKAPEGHSASPLQYEYETSSSELALAMGLGLLCATGLFVKHKSKGALPLSVFLIAVAFATGCTKKDLKIITNSPSRYLRIAQVDKDGAKTYSKVIQITPDK